MRDDHAPIHSLDGIIQSKRRARQHRHPRKGDFCSLLYAKCDACRPASPQLRELLTREAACEAAAAAAEGAAAVLA